MIFKHSQMLDLGVGKPINVIWTVLSPNIPQTFQNITDGLYIFQYGGAQKYDNLIFIGTSVIQWITNDLSSRFTIQRTQNKNELVITGTSNDSFYMYRV